MYIKVIFRCALLQSNWFSWFSMLLSLKKHKKKWTISSISIKDFIWEKNPQQKKKSLFLLMKLNTKPLKFKCGLADGGEGGVSGWRTLARHGYPHLVNNKNGDSNFKLEYYNYKMFGLFEFWNWIKHLRHLGWHQH